ARRLKLGLAQGPFPRGPENPAAARPGLSALIEDLDQRGLLNDVAVVVWGEFGRTPRINDKGGRDHWPKVCSALLAGGGLRAGQVLGSTTRWGEEARPRPPHFPRGFAPPHPRLGIDGAPPQFPPPPRPPPT